MVRVVIMRKERVYLKRAESCRGTSYGCGQNHTNLDIYETTALTRTGLSTEYIDQLLRRSLIALKSTVVFDDRCIGTACFFLECRWSLNAG
jgi:hypothetical protein